MKLDSIQIKRFRSIEEGKLTNCGGFNVLIGKNNSGKSNILSAIDAFFECIKNGSVLNLEPPFGEEIDFHGRDTKSAIEIIPTFTLSLSERDELIRDVVLEAPQMKNAVDGIDASLQLIMTLVIPSKNFGYISKITLRSSSGGSERLILGLDADTALEMYQNTSRSSSRARVAEALSKIDNSTARLFWESRTEGRSRVSASYLLRPLSLSEIGPDMRRSVESLIDTVTSPEELVREFRLLAVRIQEELANITGLPLRNKVDTFSGEEASIPQYVYNLLKRVSDINVLYLRERRKNIGREEASRPLELKVERGGPEVLRSIQETVAALLGVQIDAFRSKTPAAQPTNRGDLSAELDVDNFLVQVNGSGIREALRLILDFEFEKPSILLVEEPEVHLHPALETGLMRYLKRISITCQVFLTTHSTNFLDTAEMKNVYLVSKTSSTQIRILDVEAAESEIPKELGIRLSSLFMFDRLVFVEGPSDEAVIREWSTLLGVNLSQANVGFIHMDGVRNFVHFATERILSFLSKRQVKMWFVLDRDERDDGEVNALRERLDGRATLKVLSKREIENYLLLPRAIIELIRLKRSMAGQIIDPLPEESEITKILDESAEKLKSFAVDKRLVKFACNPVYPSRERVLSQNNTSDTSVVERLSVELDVMISQLQSLRSKASEIYKEQEELINTRWPQNKLSLAPGDMILDMVLQNWKLRFQKERDSARLASLMTENEIDVEIKTMIREIGR